MASEEDIKIEIPEQGVAQTLTKTAAIKFFDDEMTFFNQSQPLVSGNFVFENRNLGEIRLHHNAIRQLQEIKNGLGGNDLKPLAKYVQGARSLRILVGQGSIGQYIAQLASEGNQTDAKWVLFIFSRDWMAHAEQLAPFRAAALGSPSVKYYSDLVSAKAALDESKKGLKQSDAAAERLEQFIDEKTKLFADLEDLYRRKLIVDEPAISWERVATEKTNAWRRWLVVFAILVLIPTLSAMLFWREFSAGVAALTTGQGAGISLSGVAAITVPALLYAWLLKNVGRVFIQNLNLADDAAHRRTLAVTYLGLAENPKLSISETDRALILNALFRPVPPHTGDEGPPAGLIELIRKQ